MTKPLFRNIHFKILYWSIITSSIFAAIHLIVNPNYLDILILFAVYLFFIIETALWIWKRKVAQILNETIENNIPKTIAVIVVFYLLVLFIAILLYLAETFVWWQIKGFDMKSFAAHLLKIELTPGLIVNNFLLLIGVIVLLFYQWMNITKQRQKEKEEKLVYQYQTLKNQLNPHFLFNSLNVLSSIISSQPEMSETFVYKLSSIYRYVLNNNQSNLVDLVDEIKFTQEYFYLNKVRDEEKINLHIEIDSVQSYRIVPVSLQILVENSIKHNIASHDKPLNINILQYNDTIKVSNTLQRKNSFVNSSKLGLLNLNERIKILTGKELIVEETSTEFIVIVPLLPA